MKKYLSLTLFIITVLMLLAGCAGLRNQASLKGRILEIYENSVLVEPLSGESIRMSSDKISFLTQSLAKIGVSVGDIVTVTYTGEVMESYPAQIRAVSWSIYKKAANLPGSVAN